MKQNPVLWRRILQKPEVFQTQCMEPVAPLWPARFFLCGPSFSAGSHFYAANILIAYQMRYRIIYISILANVAAGDMYILWFIHE